MFLRKSIKIPIYVGKFDIVITDDKDAYNKIYAYKFGSSLLFAHAIATSLKGSNYTHYTMVLNFNYNEKINHGVIAHEALHIAGFIMDKVGVKYKFRNDEPFTYLIGWVVDEVYGFLDKHNIEVSCKK